MRMMVSVYFLNVDGFQLDMGQSEHIYLPKKVLTKTIHKRIPAHLIRLKTRPKKERRKHHAFLWMYTCKYWENCELSHPFVGKKRRYNLYLPDKSVIKWEVHVIEEHGDPYAAVKYTLATEHTTSVEHEEILLEDETELTDSDNSVTSDYDPLQWDLNAPDTDSDEESEDSNQADQVEESPEESHEESEVEESLEDSQEEEVGEESLEDSQEEEVGESDFPESDEDIEIVFESIQRVQGSQHSMPLNQEIFEQ